MRENPTSEIFDIPQFSYFSFGNPFCGSKDKLSFCIRPGEQLTVQIWHSRLCSELAQIEEEHQFPMDESGFHQALRWLETKVD